MTLAPFEALETNLSNEAKEISSPPAHSPKDSQSHKLQDLSGVTVGARPGAGDRGPALAARHGGGPSHRALCRGGARPRHFGACSAPLNYLNATRGPWKSVLDA
eukprot:scaffold7312_cov116-Isochrysis_galbana.AAC.7